METRDFRPQPVNLMESPQQGNFSNHEQRVAHVVWAAHILSYLTEKRSHIELLPSGNGEEDGFECNELDAESERQNILHGPRDSVRSKFLDCIAELLSPSKGWDNVTATSLHEQEDFVDIVIARNDCFGMATTGIYGQNLAFSRLEADYIRKLETSLSMKTENCMTLKPFPNGRSN